MVSLLVTVFSLVCLSIAEAQTMPDWKQRWEKVLSEAKKEGKVVVFGPPGELIRDAMTQGFKRAFPDIVIEYSGGRSGEQATKLKAERDAGIYSGDIFLGGTTTANFQYCALDGSSCSTGDLCCSSGATCQDKVCTR